MVQPFDSGWNIHLCLLWIQNGHDIVQDICGPGLTRWAMGSDQDQYSNKFSKFPLYNPVTFKGGAGEISCHQYCR